MIMICVSCDEKSHELKPYQIDLEKLDDYEDLLYKIDSLVCYEPRQEELELIYQDFSFPIGNICFRDYGCVLVDRFTMKDDQKSEHNIYNNNEVIKSEITNFFFNPNREAHKPISPDRGIISIQFDNEMPMEDVVFHLKRINRLYNEIEEIDFPMRVNIEYYKNPPPPPPTNLTNANDFQQKLIYDAYIQSNIRIYHEHLFINIVILLILNNAVKKIGKMGIHHIDRLEVKDFEGNVIDLFDKYEGEDLVLIFYNNACLGCTGRAIPLAYEYQKEFPFMKVIGIHSNFGDESTTEEDIKEIFSSGSLPFPIYIDPYHKLYTQVQAEGTPQWLFIRKNGEVIKSIFGSQDNAQNRLLYTFESIQSEQI